MNIMVREETEEAAIANAAEPIAIVGMSCRFPVEADTPEKYWQLLSEGRITVGEIPQKRWESYVSSAPKVAAALGSVTRFGSFLSDIEGFDADFFGISAREAEFIDPQQRIVLELSWEALENAGIPPSSLKGEDVGVYVAANSFDFGHRLMTNLAEIQPWTMNGSMLFGIANRVSYALDFRGPSMVVDTACAGSLTVLHLACQALWRREVPLAIAGGVNIMSNPGMMIALDAAGATAKDGRSKAFDQTANGYGRGEGAGLVALKRLSDARNDGDRILALIKGGGVFQDGRTAGMMAPNPEAQETMLRKTYARFGISPNSVAYVEAHGTGTQAGDKAEVGAISKVFGENRDRPCLLGSAKPNIGHLEAGAGIAGLIKTVLAIKNGVVPPSIHDGLNDQIDWETSGLKVVSESTPWPETSSPRRAGISCFGVGGTISHTIVEEAPAEAERDPEPNTAILPIRPFPVSARSRDALKANAARLAQWIESQPSADLRSIGYTLSRRRDHLSKRAVVLSSTTVELVEGLQKIASDNLDSNNLAGTPVVDGQKDPVWVFSGHGAQWPGMAQELLSTNQYFADAIDSLSDIFKRELGYTAREAIAESDWSTIERVQALTFAIQVALSAVWRSLGLRPGAVIGHSVGEVAAAVVAGALEIEDAALFACRRAAIYQRLAGRGSMAMVRLSFDEVQSKLAGNERVVAAIAASPGGTVISGDTDVLTKIVSTWKKDHIVVRKIPTIDAAFHSPQIDPLLNDIRAAAGHLITRVPAVPLYTTTLVDPRSSDDRGPDFWATNSRGAVLLVNAVTAALEDDFSAFLEVSTSPIVAPSIRETLDTLERDDVAVCATLNPNKPELFSIMASLGNLFIHGCTIRWESLHPTSDIAELPTMAWQHRPYWPTTTANSAGHGFGHSPGSHTLLGQAEHIRSTPPLTVWKTHLDFSTRPYPGMHPLFGVEIVPAAALLYSLMRAGAKNDGLAILVDIGLNTPVPVDNPLDVQIVQQGSALRISTRREDIEVDHAWAWTTHTTARLGEERLNDAIVRDMAVLRERCDEPWTWGRVERLYQKRGIGGYGFHWKMHELRRGDDEIFASFVADGSDRDRRRNWAEILDAALTICPLLLPDDELLRMPSRIGRVSAAGAAPKEYFVHVKRETEETPTQECLLGVEVLDEAGHVLATMEGVVFGVLDDAGDLTSRPTDIVFCESWITIPDASQNDKVPEQVTFVGTADNCPTALRTALDQKNVPYDFRKNPADLSPLPGAAVVVLGSGLTPGEAVEDGSERNAWTLIDTAQKLAANEYRDKGIRLFCLTHGVVGSKLEDNLAQSGLWGISRIIAGERPDLWGGLFDVDSDIADLTSGERLLSALGTATREDVVSITGGDFRALRLMPASSSDVEHAGGLSSRHDGCRPNATYLITGGLGALGLEAARYLVSRGARRLILAGRNGLPSREEWQNLNDPSTRAVVDQIEEIEAAGVTVIPLSVDVADAEALASAIGVAISNLPSIKGVIHAAGVFEGGMIGEIERSALSKSFRPKVRGAVNLHRLFPPGTLDFFVQFSSSGQFGRLTGQTCYAAANSFLDGMAKHRNAAEAPDSISLGWMAWKGVGMSRSIDASMIEARAQGMDAIEANNALKAWRYCEDLGVSYAAIFTPVIIDGNGILPLFSELVPEAKAEQANGDTASEIPTENRFDWLIGDIRHLVSIELKANESDLEIKRPLIDMGVDSLMTVSLRVRLRRRYGFEFPPTLLWNSPSVYAIAQFVDRNLVEQPMQASA